jgi:hypothetical protein
MRADPLGWIGRQGTRAVAALIVIGLAVPWAGAILKPFVGESIFILLCISFLRVDAEALKGYLRRPGLVLAATAWTSLAVPVLTGLGCVALGVNARSPDLHLALMLQAIASPMMAAPAIAALMGLDATLVLASLVASTALIPFTAAAFAELFIGPGLAISSMALGIKLAGMIVGSALVGFTLRRIFGVAAIQRQSDRINGFNVLVLSVFVAALMESISGQFFANPARALAIAALAFAMYFLVLGVTAVLFRFAGTERALAIAFMVSQRNTGLMIAAVGGVLPELAWLYFGFAQFPIYLSPQLLSPLVRRMLPAAGRA